MAQFRAHITGAVCTSTIYVFGMGALYSVERAYEQFALAEVVVFPLVLFGIGVLFGVWPDVDTDSKAQKLFYTVFLIVDLTLIMARHYEYAAYFGLFVLLPVLSRHRGWTHTWWAMLLVPAPLLVLPLIYVTDRPLVGLPFYGAAVVGYATHLALDWLPKRRK